MLANLSDGADAKRHDFVLYNIIGPYTRRYREIDVHVYFMDENHAVHVQKNYRFGTFSIPTV